MPQTSIHGLAAGVCCADETVVLAAAAASAAPAHCLSADRLEHGGNGWSTGSGSVMLLRTLLGERFAKGLFLQVHVSFVAVGVEEGVGGAGEAVVLGEHVVVVAMGAEEDVAGERFQDGESLGEVGGDFGVVGIVDEAKAGIDVGAADDDDIVGFSGVGRFPGPGGAAA